METAASLRQARRTPALVTYTAALGEEAACRNHSLKAVENKICSKFQQKGELTHTTRIQSMIPPALYAPSLRFRWLVHPATIKQPSNLAKHMEQPIIKKRIVNLWIDNLLLMAAVARCLLVASQGPAAVRLTQNATTVARASTMSSPEPQRQLCAPLIAEFGHRRRGSGPRGAPPRVPGAGWRCSSPHAPALEAVDLSHCIGAGTWGGRGELVRMRRDSGGERKERDDFTLKKRWHKFWTDW